MDWIHVTNGKIDLSPIERHPSKKEFYSSYDIKITNISNEVLFVTTIALIHSNHEISSYPFDGKTIQLGPNRSATFSNVIFLDKFMELYNWHYEKVSLKFIVNNSTDITQEIPFLIQPGFKEPIMPYSGKEKGSDSPSNYGPYQKHAIYESEISLLNPTVNQITGILKNRFDEIIQNELIQPYIERLYLDISTQFITTKYTPKPANVTTNEKGGSLKMNIGNLIDYNRRNRRFKKLLKLFPNKPVIVAEGDSWFLYPILVKDTLDYIMESWPLKSLAWAGDTLENYKKSGQLLKYVKKLRPKYVLISGGGNDIIGSEIQRFLKQDVSNAKHPRDYLNGAFEKQLKTLEDYYNFFFKEISSYACVERIIVHGYDYIRADHAKIVTKGGWLNKYLEKAGIHDYRQREKLIKFLIDEFNTLLERASWDYEKVKYLNLRGLIDKDEWFDEIHPNNEGYRKVADRFLSAIN